MEIKDSLVILLGQIEHRTDLRQGPRRCLPHSRAHWRWLLLRR